MEREYIRAKGSPFGNAGSPWLETEVPQHPTLEGDLQTDVVIVGAGIAGALVAAELTSRGLNVAVLERRRAAGGTTGHSTAKITILHGSQWSDIVRTRGLSAGLFEWASLNTQAPEIIGRMADELGILCGFRALEGFLCARLDEHDDALAREWQSLRLLGLGVDDAEGYADSPFGRVVALRAEAQAQFDPAAFTLGLLGSLPEAQATLFEGTPVRSVEPSGGGWIAHSDAGSVRAPVIVMTSLATARDPALLFTRAFPYAHYAVAVTPGEERRDGMWIQVGGSELTARPMGESAGSWIVSGASTRLAHEREEQSLFRVLARQTSAEFGVSEPERYWSAEDFETPDRLPYVGRLGARDGLYFIGGFGGWGMTKSVVSASFVADEIEGVASSALRRLLSPNRFPRLRTWPALLAENAYPLRRLLFPATVQRSSPAALPPVIASAGDEPPRCTHLGCRTKVNTAEHTLDCPCHGSRYGSDGHPIYGPARRNVRVGASLSGPSER